MSSGRNIMCERILTSILVNTIINSTVFCWEILRWILTLEFVIFARQFDLTQNSESIIGGVDWEWKTHQNWFHFAA